MTASSKRFLPVDLAGKRVLVTAGAAGIGRVIAEGFASAGAKVHVCDVNPDAVESAIAAKFSATVRAPKTRGVWKVLRTPARARRAGVRRFNGSPSSRTLPSSGYSLCCAISTWPSGNASLAVPPK